jgi:hypothetical protein
MSGVGRFSGLATAIHVEQQTARGQLPRERKAASKVMCHERRVGIACIFVFVDEDGEEDSNATRVSFASAFYSKRIS